MTRSPLTTLLRFPFLPLCIIYSKTAMSLKRSDIEQKKAEVGEKQEQGFLYSYYFNGFLL